MKLSDILKEIRRVHVELQEPGAMGHSNGICHNVYLRAIINDEVEPVGGQDLYFQWEDNSKRWYRSWPLFSGRSAYPVVGVKDELSRYGQDMWRDGDPQLQAVLSFDYAPKWRGITGYQRAQLLDHCIKCAESEGL